MMWMCRSRPVGRDFNFLEYRENVYSPASSASVVKLLPCMALSDAFVNNAVIATLDVSDACCSLFLREYGGLRAI